MNSWRDDVETGIAAFVAVAELTGDTTRSRLSAR